MAVRGIFASHSGILGDRQEDLSARVLMTGPAGQAPLLALSSGMPTRDAKNTGFSWIEDEHISGNSEVVTGGNAAAATFVVQDVNLWVPMSVLMNEMTGEYFLVTAINSDTNTVTAIRGFAGTTAQAITAGDTIQSIGSAHPEGGDKPAAVSQQGSERTNYVQIFKNGWAITGTANAIGYTTGGKLAQNRQLCFNYHAEDIERAFLWSRKGVRVFDGKQLRTSHGIIPQIQDYGGIVESANSNGNAGELNLDDLSDFMRRIFDVQAKGMPNERIAFAGSGTLQQIQRMVFKDTTYQIESDETEYGIRVQKIIGFNGSLKLITHPMMVENRLWSHELYVLHPGMISKRVLRKTWTEEFGPGRQHSNNGKDAIEGYIADELGFEVRGAKTMGILRNIQKGVASE